MSNFANDKITQQEIQIELKKDGDVIENLLLKEQSLTDVKEVKELSGCAKSFNSIKGYSLGLLYALLTCTANVFVKMAPTLDGSNHAVVRYLIQFLVMLFFIKKKKLQLLGPKKSRKLLFLRGFVGSLGGILGFFSIKYLDVSDYETLTNSCVLLTALLARIFLKEKLSVCHFFATVLTITGVMFIIRPEFLFGIEVDLEDFFHVNLTQHNLNINQTFVDSHGHVQNLGILNHSTRKFTESIIGLYYLHIL
jgi:drug/metabolite transporter (DMT)-like permease